MKAPNIKKEESKMSMKALVGKRITKDVDFMGEKITISKLSVSQVMDIQEQSKLIAGSEVESLNTLKLVIVSSVEEANDLSDEDFRSLPMDELSKLSSDIMKYSGLGVDAGK